jgi:hypothetical protein
MGLKTLVSRGGGIFGNLRKIFIGALKENGYDKRYTERDLENPWQQLFKWDLFM